MHDRIVYATVVAECMALVEFYATVAAERDGIVYVTVRFDVTTTQQNNI